jgi:hypothetical protein
MIQKDFSPDGGKMIQRDGSIFYLSDLLNTLYNASNNGYEAFKIFDIDRCMINNGLMFQTGNIYTSLAFGEHITTVWKCPIGRKTHIKNLVITSEGATLSGIMKTGITFDENDGIDITSQIRNTNENFPNYSEQKYQTGKLFANATYSGGEIWKPIVIHGSTTNQSTSGGSYSDFADIELVTKDDGSYSVLDIENIDEDGDTAYAINVNFMFYDMGCDV